MFFPNGDAFPQAKNKRQNCQVLDAHSFRQLVESAAAAGFDAVSVWARTHRRATTREGLDEAEMRALLEGHGLVVSEFEALDTWLPSEVKPLAGNPPLSVEEFLRVGEALRARTLVAVQSAPVDLPFDAVVAHFADLCDRARERGLDVALEAPPFTAIADLVQARKLVEAADRPNAGVVVDSWHHRRSGVSDAVFEGLAPERVLCLQFADGPTTPEEDLLEETIWRRLPVGTGDFELAGLLRRLDAMGVRCPVGVEVFDETGEHGDPAQTAHRLYAQLDSLCGEADSRLGRARGSQPG